MKPILIHTHFHKRRTGVTTSIENVLPFFDAKFETYLYGYGAKGKHITFQNLVKLLFSDRTVVVHCHRNNEIIRMLFFRLLGAKFKLIATRHAETIPSNLTLKLLKKADKVVTLIESMSKKIGIEKHPGVTGGKSKRKLTMTPCEEQDEGTRLARSKRSLLTHLVS